MHYFFKFSFFPFLSSLSGTLITHVWYLRYLWSNVIFSLLLLLFVSLSSAGLDNLYLCVLWSFLLPIKICCWDSLYIFISIKLFTIFDLRIISNTDIFVRNFFQKPLDRSENTLWRWEFERATEPLALLDFLLLVVARLLVFRELESGQWD